MGNVFGQEAHKTRSTRHRAWQHYQPVAHQTKGAVRSVRSGHKHRVWMTTAGAKRNCCSLVGRGPCVCPTNPLRDFTSLCRPPKVTERVDLDLAVLHDLGHQNITDEVETLPASLPQGVHLGDDNQETDMHVVASNSIAPKVGPLSPACRRARKAQARAARVAEAKLKQKTIEGDAQLTALDIEDPQRLYALQVKSGSSYPLEYESS